MSYQCASISQLLLTSLESTLFFTPVDEHGNKVRPRHILIEGVDNLYCFGSHVQFWGKKVTLTLVQGYRILIVLYQS